jgi:flagellar biogenesis protein FliO
VNRVTSPSQRGPVIRLGWLGLVLTFVLFPAAFNAFGETQPAASYAAVPGGFPDAGYSVVRVFGALIVVISIFFGGIWLFRNWQRLALRKGGAPRLNVIEVRSLGQRQALYVVGYDQQRMLLASSPAGVTLVSHLPAAEEGEAAAAVVPAPSFAEAFQQVFQRKA